MIRKAFAVAALLVLASCGESGSQSSTKLPSTLTVFAASSLRPAFDKIAAKLKSLPPVEGPKPTKK